MIAVAQKKSVKKNTARKNSANKKRTSSKGFKLELKLKGTLYLGLFVFLAMIWAFMLGVFVGRGYRPEDYVPKLSEVMPREKTSEQAEKKPPRTLKAEELGFLQRLTKDGTQKRAQKSPTTKKPASRQDAGEERAVSGNRFEYLYQVASFRERQRAGKLRTKLVHSGITASVKKAVADSKQWYRVLVSFRGTESQDKEIRKEMKRLGITDPFLKDKKPCTDY